MTGRRPAGARWPEKGGRAEVDDWRTWLLLGWTIVAVVITITVNDAHGWVAASVSFLALLGLEAGFFAVLRSRRRRG